MESFEWQQELGASTSAFVTLMGGLLFYNGDNYTEAIRRFDQALKLALSSDEIISPTPILLYRGGAHTFLEDYEKAIDDFDYIVKTDPETEYGYYVFNDRGAAYARMGNYEQALENYNFAINIKLNEFIGYASRGLIYMKFGQYDKAIIDFSMSIDINSKFATVFYSRGLS